jgi:hypothetical protein
LLIDVVPALVMFRTVVLGDVVVTDEFLGSMLDMITAMAPSSTSA